MEKSTANMSVDLLFGWMNQNRERRFGSNEIVVDGCNAIFVYCTWRRITACFKLYILWMYVL